MISRLLLQIGWIHWLLLLLSPRCCWGGQHEDRLIKDILTNRSYNANARPVENERDAVEVKFGISLQQIINLDEKQEMLHTNMWLNYEWRDYKLSWDSADYGGVESIRLPAGTIWTPDVLMYNSADEDINSMYPTNIVVSSDGTCTWIPLGLYISSCSIDIRWYPFDDQYCTMKFGSWTYDGTKINLTAMADTINLDTYQESGEWNLLEVPAVRSIKFYDCCPEPYIDITFTLHIRRRTLYHGLNLIIPCALISMLAIFTFTLPPDTNAKVSLGITILLSLSVFQMIVADLVPATSLAVPLVGMYSACLMMMCTISMIVTIVVLSFHHRKPEMYKMSPFIQRYICGWLAWLLRMSRPGVSNTLADLTRGRKSPGHGLLDATAAVINIAHNGRDADVIASQAHRDVSGPTARGRYHAHSGRPATAMSHPLTAAAEGGAFTPFDRLTQIANEPRLPLTKVLTELRAILAELLYVTRKMKDDSAADDEVNEWKFAAMVIDRLCLWIFTVYLIITTFAIFFSTKNVFE